MNAPRTIPETPVVGQRYAIQYKPGEMWFIRELREGCYIAWIGGFSESDARALVFKESVVGFLRMAARHDDEGMAAIAGDLLANLKGQR